VTAVTEIVMLCWLFVDDPRGTETCNVILKHQCWLEEDTLGEIDVNGNIISTVDGLFDGTRTVYCLG